MKKYSIFKLGDRDPFEALVVEAQTESQAIGYFKRDHPEAMHLILVAKEEKQCQKCKYVYSVYATHCPSCDEPNDD